MPGWKGESVVGGRRWSDISMCVQREAAGCASHPALNGASQHNKNFDPC